MEQLRQAKKGETVFLSLGTNDAVGGAIDVKAKVAQIVAEADRLGVKLVWIGPPCVLKPWEEYSRKLDGILADRTRRQGDLRLHPTPSSAGQLLTPERVFTLLWRVIPACGRRPPRPQVSRRPSPRPNPSAPRPRSRTAGPSATNAIGVSATPAVMLARPRRRSQPGPRRNDPLVQVSRRAGAAPCSAGAAPRRPRWRSPRSPSRRPAPTRPAPLTVAFVGDSMADGLWGAHVPPPWKRQMSG